MNTTTGAWQYTVLKGSGAGNVYTGAGTITAGSGYLRVAALPGSGFSLNLTYYTTAHLAVANFAYRAGGVSSALYDKDTTNNPPCL